MKNHRSLLFNGSTSVEGRNIEVIRFGMLGKKILIIGGIHGHTERQSVDFCNNLISKIRTLKVPLHCQVLIIPELNPDSTNVKRVQTNANGIDLNRNFPSTNQHLADKKGKNKGGVALSEPESRIVYDIVRYEKPVVIFAIHQKYICLDYDGPIGSDLLDDLERVFDLPAKPLDAYPGSMGTYFGIERGIPVITVEFEYRMTQERILETAQRFADYLSRQT